MAKMGFRLMNCWSSAWGRWTNDNKDFYGKEFLRFLHHFRQTFGEEVDWVSVQVHSHSLLLWFCAQCDLVGMGPNCHPSFLNDNCPPKKLHPRFDHQLLPGENKHPWLLQVTTALLEIHRGFFVFEEVSSDRTNSLLPLREMIRNKTFNLKKKKKNYFFEGL